MQHREKIGAAILAAGAVVATLGAACKKPQSDAGEARSSATVHAAEIPATPPPPSPRARSGAIDAVEVGGDRAVLVIEGADTRRPIVFLHGMCSEPRGDLEAWGASVSAHGTVIALLGDKACPGSPEAYTWTVDPVAIDARIDAAVEVVRGRGTELDERRLVVIGESMGASRAEALARRFPARYGRLVLVGGPDTPSAKSLGAARKVALLAGEKEPQDKMRRGEAGLAAAGIAARFWELPDATHGTYGTEGRERMSEAVAFVVSD
jgi:pimeloyl-ACP methyl ester carboxylesterase